nr:dehydrogenase/reductase SDR family member 7-like isoform X2 [Pocillopora verrucosa]
MGRKLLIAALVVPFVCYLFFKYQDGDFTLMIYEKISRDPGVALRGKVVWITGASSGIGEYLAYELAKYGCKLVLSARRKAELERVKEKCAAIANGLDSSFKKDQDILVLPLDLTEFDSHEKLTQEVLKHFGKVDILVNNGARSQRSLVKKTPLEVDKALLDSNLIGWPYGATYCASKHALQGYFDSARIELTEHNIRVQTVLPGPVKSNIGRHAFTEDVKVEFKNTPNYQEYEGKMPTERCAKLMVVGMANNLDELWISNNPMLLMTYANQYFPTVFKWFSNEFLMERITKLYMKGS